MSNAVSTWVTRVQFVNFLLLSDRQIDELALAWDCPMGSAHLIWSYGDKCILRMMSNHLLLRKQIFFTKQSEIFQKVNLKWPTPTSDIYLMSIRWPGDWGGNDHLNAAYLSWRGQPSDKPYITRRHRMPFSPSNELYQNNSVVTFIGQFGDRVMAIFKCWQLSVGWASLVDCHLGELWY